MRRFFMILSFVVSLTSCSKTAPEIGSGRAEWVDSGTHGQIVLGEKLNDPYTVENMTEALNELYPTKAGRSVLDPTDLYVRFLPLNDGQYQMLEDMGVSMLDHPLDYRIVREGDYYHDPQIADRDITWQYAVVDVDFKFPDEIPYEVLDRCYIAEHAATKSSDIDWDAVERLSFCLTGNEDLLSPAAKGGEGGMVPSGRITIVDEDYNGGEPFGLAGVMVECNIFVKIDVCYTDQDGRYQMRRSFSGDPRYRLIFKNRKGFALGFNWVIVPGSISTLGQDSPAGVSVEISRKSDWSLFCRSVVNNTVSEYYDSCSDNGAEINTPPENLRIWLFYLLNVSSAPMLQQGVWIDNELIAKFFDSYTWIVKMFMPDVTIAMRDCNSYKDIYSATMHQMAHASHFSKVGRAYWEQLFWFALKSFVANGGSAYGSQSDIGSGYSCVSEMWAFYCQTFFCRRRYGADQPADGTGHWFHPQIFLTLESRGLDRMKIFKALSGDVHDNDALEKRLISLYPECRSEISQVFDRYE